MATEMRILTNGFMVCVPFYVLMVGNYGLSLPKRKSMSSGPTLVASLASSLRMSDMALCVVVRNYLSSSAMVGMLIARMQPTIVTNVLNMV